MRFAGHYADAESGWAYNRFRYYNPTLGAYNAQDPLGLAPTTGLGTRICRPRSILDRCAWVDGTQQKERCTNSTTFRNR
ncbi:RHS repeat-associated core domain-containing protein [Corynebacterium macclintockiae]|uniref:RHS repeat-associated core domain-containing protein n=1 Tax=Corynebacterium macclintockiae TaxID=2913501 RepID=UPI00254E3F2A|nr:RHS repeat-associated core domain-containing protein [Corynebacterium macclintockiae]MDK8891793.1 RHS repeat-associated core domain-containing protein [Corynebacterium macclintockiae]